MMAVAADMAALIA